MTNNYLLQSEFFFYVLIDTAISNGKDKLIRQLIRKGISPNQIKLIIITHSHYDHTGCLAAIKDWSGAQVLASPQTTTLIESGRTAPPVFSNTIINNAVKKVLSKNPEHNNIRHLKVDIVIDKEYDLSEWGINGKIIATPGHTNCSISVILEDGRAFTGDTLFNISPFTIMPPIVENRELLLQSWQTLIDSGSEYYYPGHGGMIPRKRFLEAIKKASK